MRITRIDVFALRYTIAGGTFSMSGGKSAAQQDSTIVRVETDEGLVGWGEQCGFSPRYLAAYGEGVRSALTLIAPAVIGLDPRRVQRVYDAMDGALKGHLYAKAAIDIACWDLLGRATGLPLRDLLGGAYREQLPLYIGIGIDTPERMRAACERARAAGYRRIQLKVGSDALTDITRINSCLEVLDGFERVIADANGFWSQHEAARVVAALDDRDIFFEQPCATMDECAAVRRRSRRPFILDESIEGMDDLLRARQNDAADAVMLKFSRFGGITPICRARDLAIQLGFAMTIEDSAGGDIVSAAMAQIGATIPDNSLINGSLIGRMVEERIVTNWSPLDGGGFGTLPAGSGLGICVEESRLGTPVLTFG
ncbi:MAG TPA: mandelate racemase/muconate lactonizing enzyme family protein [Dongiaceae bacterium]|nr:mandelate racemase/muconate lactonizing enzyme family protein [Dongiaceae bacterium]